MAGSPLLKLSVRNLAAHKGRLALTVLSVLLGTAFIAGSMVFTGSLQKTFDQLSDGIAVGVDARVSPDDDRSPGVPVALAETVAKVDGVRTTVPFVGGPISLRDSAGKVIQSLGPPTQGGQYFAPNRALDREAATITEGVAPTKPNEMVINESAANTYGLTVGTKTEVMTALLAKPITVTVVGLFTSPTDAGGAVSAQFTPGDATKLFTNRSTYPYIDVAAADISPQELVTRLKAVAPNEVVQTGDEVRADFSAQINKSLSFINYFLVAFGVIGLIVGIFLIYNTFAMIVAQRLRELALLRAIGASREQVRNSVVLEALVVGLLGSVLGLAAGVGLAQGLRALINAFGGGFPDGGLTIPPTAIVTVLLVGTGVTVVSALIPAVRAARTPPVAAMREQDAGPEGALGVRGAIGAMLVINAIALLFVASINDGSAAAIPVGLAGFAMIAAFAVGGPALSQPVIGAVGKVVAPLFGPAGRLGRTNAVRNPRRTTATAFALVIGVALVAIIGTLGASMNATINKEFSKGLASQLLIDAKSGGLMMGGGMPQEAVTSVSKLPQVTKKTIMYSLPVTVAGQSTTGRGVDGSLPDALTLSANDGDLTLRPGGFLASSGIAAARGWQVGQILTLKSLVGPQTVNVTVNGIYNAADNGVIGSWMVTRETMNRLYPAGTATTSRPANTNPTNANPANSNPANSNGVAANPNSAPPPSLITPTEMFVSGANSESVDELRAAVEKAVDPLMVVRVQTLTDLINEAGTQVSAMMQILYGLLGLAVIIAILGIVNTLSLSVVERRREIGMLRAIGTLRKQIRRSLYLESMLIAVFGAVVGLALGLVLGTSLVRALHSQGLTVVAVPWVQVVVMLAASGVVGIVAAILPGIRAAGTKPLEAIAQG